MSAARLTPREIAAQIMADNAWSRTEGLDIETITETRNRKKFAWYRLARRTSEPIGIAS